MTAPAALSDESKFLIDFNVCSVPAALGLDIPPVAAAAMLDISEGDYENYIREAADTVRASGRRLLERPEVANAIDSWQIPAAGTVLAVGDSITTYRYSFAHLLAAMLQDRREEEGIRFVNAGQSGYTSSLGLETTYSQNLAYQPDWVLIKFGVNDCKQFGGKQAHPLVSADEYRANMAAIVNAYRRFSNAQIVLLTPTPVVESITDINPDLATMRLHWRNANLATYAEIIRNLADKQNVRCVDLMAAFGLDPDPTLFLPDGLHPNPAGHQIIAEHTLFVLQVDK